jgi:ABC-type oligopeptide transport system ATPase subunit
VSLTVRRGEILGLVGESGSGKTTLGEVILRLQPVTSGEIRFAGADLRGMSRRDIRGFRRRAQMIFQEAQEPVATRRVASLIFSLTGSKAFRRRSLLIVSFRVGGPLPDLATKYRISSRAARPVAWASPGRSRCGPSSSWQTSRQRDWTSPPLRRS